MSQANIPDINPEITITTDDSVKLILSSIGMEELSLSHILNAEAEKVQYSLGTLETSTGPFEMPDIIKMNKSANKMVKDSIKSSILLNMKLNDTIEFDEARRTFKVKSGDDVSDIIENAPDNSTVTFAAGDYELANGLDVTKNLTLKGTLDSNNVPISTLTVKEGETLNVKEALTISNFAIKENNPIGIPAIALTQDNAKLTLSKVTATVDGSGNANTFEGNESLIQITNTPGSSTSGMPKNTTVSIKNSDITFNGNYGTAVSYAGGTSGNIEVSDTKIAFVSPKGNATYSKGISLNQDTAEEINVKVSNTEITDAYYPFYMRGAEGSANLTISNSKFSGYAGVYLRDFNNSVANITNSELTGNNLYVGGGANDFYTLSVQNSSNSTINVKDSTVMAVMQGEANQYPIGSGGEVAKTIVNLTQNTEIIVEVSKELPKDYVMFDNFTPEQIKFDTTVKFFPDDVQKFKE